MNCNFLKDILKEGVPTKHNFLWLGLTCLMLGGCSTQAIKISHDEGGKHKGQQGAALPSAGALQVPIGTVHMVDQAGQFILIKSSRTTSLEPETQIITYGPDATMTSHLKASPARKGPYLTADLVDGVPNIGDMVMMVKKIETATEDPFSGKPNPANDVQVLE